MKRLHRRGALLLTALLFAVGLGTPRAQAKEPSVSAAGCVVLEAETGRVLYAENAHTKLPMASTTKIMTALLAIEHGGLEEVIAVPKEASGVEGSSIYLEVGEHITLENLLYGLMMHSGNDAAEAIALHVDGSIEGFAEKMNARAKEIGANNTHFVNPHGLPAEGHYTTAYDLALIAAEAMKNETFRTIVSTTDRTIPWEGHEWDRVLHNKNKMLYQYQWANGIKTGYTKAAGRCLVTGALKDGMQLICVVLNCPDMYEDSAELLDYGFENYTLTRVLAKNAVLGEIPVKNGMEPALEVRLKDDIVVPLNQSEKSSVSVRISMEESLEAPVEAGQKLGTVEVYLGESLLVEKELRCTQEIPVATVKFYWDKVLKNWLIGGFLRQ